MVKHARSRPPIKLRRIAPGSLLDILDYPDYSLRNRLLEIIYMGSPPKD